MFTWLVRLLFWDCFYILGLSGYEMDVVESIVWGFGIFWGGQLPSVVGLGAFVRTRVFPCLLFVGSFRDISRPYGLCSL